MNTYYVNYYEAKGGEVFWWMKWPLVRVTRNSLGREVRELVGSGYPVPPPRTIGKMEMQVCTFDERCVTRKTFR